MENSLLIAKNCRHYAMCKIDFLGSGICLSGTEKHYVSYYPQGRMILFEGLAENRIPVTEKCVEIAETCNLCGKCDYQCYFVTELRPTIVMTALKNKVRDYIEKGGEVFITEEDEVLKEIRAIVGYEWATNDPAVLYTYCHDMSPVSPPKMPDYVVMPFTKEEISDLVNLFNAHQVKFTIRGNGSNLLGFAVSEGAIIDLNRMKSIEFHEKNWYVKVGPGVTAFDVQREARKRGLRINAGEPASLICSNIMGSGVMTTFSTTYGINADNFIDAEFISNEGVFFRLNDRSSPNLYAYEDLKHKSSPGICISANVRLHPVTEDESGILVPFSSIEEAVSFGRDCAVRHIGIAIAVLGTEYISVFFSPTKKMAGEVKKIFDEQIEMPFMVLVIGDKYSIRSIRSMDVACIDQKLLNVIYLGLPALRSARWLDLIKGLSNGKPYEYLNLNHFTELVETALYPTPGQLAGEVDPDLRKFFEKLYSRSEMTDMVWLTTFRILSTRIGRKNPFLPVVIYLPLDYELIRDITEKYILVAQNNNLEHAFGFITPIDDGKRCIYEYDFFYNYNDPSDLQRIRAAAAEVNTLIDKYTIDDGTVRGHPYVLYQGFARKENLLYS